MKWKLPEIPEEFKNLPNFLEHDNVKDDFVDDEWKGRPSVRLYRLSNRDACSLGRVVVQKLGTGFSQSDVGALFLLAFQLRKQGDGVTGFVFPERDLLSSVNDVGYETLDKEISSVRVRVPVPLPTESFSESKNATGYAFLAASILRLFRRTPENLLRAWGHIKNRYADFYGEPFPISNVQPDQVVLEYIHRRFSFAYDNLFKATLYRIVYMSNESQDSGNLKKFLYDIHLSHTGMHILPIFCNLCIALNCNKATLLPLLKCKMYEKQIILLCKVLELMADKTENHKRGMWRYGRVFDEKFMSPLQTRSCPKLVMLLACMLQHVNPNLAGNILAIKQLEDVSEEFREICINKAEKNVKLVRDAKEKTNSLRNRTT